ncbi:MAG: D-2-hydroxyacid dehydrogenase [Chloroflexi bacterium]|nr:D-2-hydroxyacid dehydrogenase [Chloroflexota bacterium]
MRMKQVNVLVVSKLNMHEEFLKDIEAVDPSVSARDASGLFAKELRQEGPGENKWTTETMIAALERDTQEELARGVDSRTEGRSLDSLLGEAEVMFANLIWPKNILARAPRLKWLHLSGTGIDRYLGSEVFGGRIVVTNSRGAVAVPIAEHVMALTFSLAKDMPRLIQNKGDKRWERFINIELSGKTMGVVGMGAIGSNLTRMAKGIGMRVIATRRHAMKREHDVGYVDEVFPFTELLGMLKESDFVALALPLTEESRKLIGEKELRAMKPSAYIINVSRGPIIDQSVLVRALKEGWIAGAGLDVFEREPLPAESELWGMPNVILSPHMAGSTDMRDRHVTQVFANNLKRYVSGQPLVNVVTKEGGY